MMTYTLQRDNAERDLKALRELLDPGRLIVPARETFEVLRELRDSIEEQVKPAIEEPTEFGSLIRAAAPHHYRALWTPSPTSGDHYWMSEKGYVEVWSGLTDVEVLRVGLGEADPDVWKLQEDAWDEGARRFASQLHGRLQLLYAESITSERKNAYEKAIQAVEELAP